MERSGEAIMNTGENVGFRRQDHRGRRWPSCYWPTLDWRWSAPAVSS